MLRREDVPPRRCQHTTPTRDQLGIAVQSSQRRGVTLLGVDDPTAVRPVRGRGGATTGSPHTSPCRGGRLLDVAQRSKRSSTGTNLGRAERGRVRDPHRWALGGCVVRAGAHLDSLPGPRAHWQPPRARGVRSARLHRRVGPDTKVYQVRQRAAHFHRLWPNALVTPVRVVSDEPGASACGGTPCPPSWISLRRRQA
jgi:hypothetical protein